MTRERQVTATPFAIVPLWVLERLEPEDRATGVLVYVVLRRFADRFGYCYPSNARVAELAGVSTSTVQRAKRRLKQVGALSIEPRPDPERPGRYAPTPLYVLRSDPPD